MNDTETRRPWPYYILEAYKAGIPISGLIIDIIEEEMGYAREEFGAEPC